MQSFDPIYLQRLVDHELDRNDIRKMLEMAENNPRLWRDMASSFVEDQLWQDDIRELNNADSSGNLTPTQAKRLRANKGPRFSVWLAIAAGVVITLTAGMFLGRNIGDLFDGSGIAITKNAPGNSAPADGLVANQPPALDSADQTLVDYRPDCHLELKDANGNPVIDSEIPLYSPANAEKAGIRLDQSPQISGELMKQIQRTGYGLAHHVNYISGRLNDGRSFVVPVRTINLRPGQ